VLFYVFYDFYVGFYNQKSPEISQYFYLVFPFAGLLAFQLALESLARVYLRTAIPAFLREFLLRLLIAGSVVLYAQKTIDFPQLVIFRLLCYGVVCVLLLAYLVRLGVPFWYVNRRFFRQENILPIVRFGFFIFLGGIGIALVMKIDILMLGMLLNQKEVGIFTIAYFIGNVLEIPRKSMAQITQPLIAQAWQENNLALIQKMYAQSSRNALIVGGWFFLGIWLNIDNLFAYVPHSEVYQAGKYVVLWVAIARLLDMGMGLNNEIITQSKFYLFNFIAVLVLLVLVISFNLWLIPLYGIVGASVSSLLSIFVLNIVKFIFLYQKFGFQPFSGKHLWILLIGGLCFQIVWIPVFLPTWADIVLRSGLITLLYWASNLACQTSDEVGQLWHTFRRKRSARG
jgi:O-antigen/teichoic acid export membrane protein